MIYQKIWHPYAKLFADDTSLFSVVRDVNTSAKELNDDSKKVNDWSFQWKMSFNPDPSKQAQKVIFSCKSKWLTHPPLVFNNNVVSQTFSQKQLGAILDFISTFEEYLHNVSAKVDKAVRLLHKLRNFLPRTTLITITNLSFGLIWTMVAPCIKSLITSLRTNWNLFNIIHV